jgi:cytochrome b involved in lipid metabolism
MAHEMLAQYYVATIGEKKSDIAQLQPTLAPGQPTPTLKPGQPTPTVAVVPTAKPIATNTNVNTAVTLSAGEVASHNTLANCWMIISGKVYDITSYVYQHPGGAGAIAPYCGKDGTNAFATKNTGSSHSSYAHNLLNNFLVGTLGSSIVIPTINPGNPVPTTVPVVIVPTATTVPGQAGGNNQPTATPVPQNLNLTSAEVANHNTLQNCWMIVSNKVYNVTSYVYQHPGGANAIAPYCGKDGTTAFATRGGTGSHSNYANNLLNGFLIGTLNSSVSVVPTNTPVPGAPTNTPAPGVPTNTPVPSGSSGLPAAITDKYPGATKRSGGYEDNGSWEGKINTAGGQCREMKVNSGGSITQDQGC